MIIREYEANRRDMWAYQFAAIFAVEIGSGSDHIAMSKKLLKESGLFNPDDDDKEEKMEAIHKAVVRIINNWKKTIPSAKFAEPYITASAILFYAKSVELQYANDRLAEKIKEIDPDYYNANIERIYDTVSGGSGASGKWREN